MKLQQSLSEEQFADRHIGPSATEVEAMLSSIGVESLDALMDQTVPQSIRSREAIRVGTALTERELLARLRAMAEENQIFKSYIGMGYYDCVTPPVILRNVLENPGWYTQYTPYQAEIAQGRLEALLNFQTLVMDLTGMEIANASLLDEGTAAAEAMALFYAARSRPKSRAGANVFFVDQNSYPQTIEILRTRAEPLGIELHIGQYRELEWNADYFGAFLQYPAGDGSVEDYSAFCEAAHSNDALVVVACDLLSLLLLRPPGEFGADVAVGSSQRFGVPMGFGGPHAAFFATSEKYKRQLPGRIIGVSMDSQGNTAYRMALQTREQHIRREKATSNICTAQVLLAVIAGMYAVYHGPEGLRRIARRVHTLSRLLADGLRAQGFEIVHRHFFDTLKVRLSHADAMEKLRIAATEQGINLRYFDDESAVGIALDETTGRSDVESLLSVFAVLDGQSAPADPDELASNLSEAIPEALRRRSAYLTHPVFNRYHAETEMLRYLKRLENRDLSLAHSMIALGSCTMKLNATAEMIPVTWPEFGAIHPFAPTGQTRGYQALIRELEEQLCAITEFHAVSLQPNSGAQGEYAGLLVIKAYHRSRGDTQRNIVLIPSSAHGTNPASAVMAGMRVVVVQCDRQGNIDVDDLRRKAEEHGDHLAALMVTYPSTHGVFEEAIQDICGIVHEHGGQVYMDGANLNAQVGLTSPARIGADVCHLNLHKTFCIPHGGGGPGMGPIAVASHLAPFLPGHPLVPVGGEQAISAVSAAPWGSASILLISYAYIAMMGGKGLAQATRVAILNANYIKARLEAHFSLLYTGARGRVGHEMIVDTRAFKASAGVEVEDIAKRLIDYGYHAPTVSFPVPGTLMIEPTESETKEELDRFCDTLIAIRAEIAEIEDGRADHSDNVLKNAPHTAAMATSDEWTHSYSRAKAVYPQPAVRESKFWPAVARVNNTYGDRNLMCACPPVDAYEEETSAAELVA